MSHIRQNYDNGHDIASAMENGKPHDFDSETPTMTTPTPPTAEELEKDPGKQQVHDDKVKSLEMMLKVKLQGFVKREEMCKENVVKAHTLLIQQCAERMENQLKNCRIGEGDKGRNTSF